MVLLVDLSVRRRGRYSKRGRCARVHLGCLSSTSVPLYLETVCMQGVPGSLNDGGVLLPLVRVLLLLCRVQQ